MELFQTPEFWEDGDLAINKHHRDREIWLVSNPRMGNTRRWNQNLRAYEELPCWIAELRKVTTNNGTVRYATRLTRARPLLDYVKFNVDYFMDVAEDLRRLEEAVRERIARG